MDYSVMVRHERAAFSSSHFVVEGERCESLHGHTYGVSVELGGALDSTGYVVDFSLLKRLTLEVTSNLDHKVLIAQENPLLEIREAGAGIEVSLKDKRYVFPRDECVLLPLPNCTAENLASLILHSLRERLAVEDKKNISWIRVGVAESEAQWGYAQERFTP